MHQKDEEKRLQVLKWIKLLEDFILRVFTDFFAEQLLYTIEFQSLVCLLQRRKNTQGKRYKTIADKLMYLSNDDTNQSYLIKVPKVVEPTNK